MTMANSMNETLGVSSMTGFSRCEGRDDNVVWSWEIKSVNSKGLDIRCRLPSGFDRLDVIVRERLQKTFKRGSFFANLNLKQEYSQGGYQLNAAVLDAAMNAVPAIMERFPNAAPPSVDGLLAIRGVLEPIAIEESNGPNKELDNILLAGLNDAIKQLAVHRGEEGGRLKNMLSTHVSTIKSLHGQSTRFAENQTSLMRQRIEQGVAALLDRTPALSEDRLAQEAAVLATKADVREELDRLDAHCTAANELLNEGGAIGRKFDFLCQELNREANTLCSKSIDTDLTKAGLGMKVTIDQLREQVQNVE